MAKRSSVEVRVLAVFCLLSEGLCRLFVEKVR
jgi:hypothetical protein